MPWPSRCVTTSSATWCSSSCSGPARRLLLSRGGSWARRSRRRPHPRRCSPWRQRGRSQCSSRQSWRESQSSFFRRCTRGCTGTLWRSVVSARLTDPLMCDRPVVHRFLGARGTVPSSLSSITPSRAIYSHPADPFPAAPVPELQHGGQQTTDGGGQRTGARQDRPWAIRTSCGPTEPPVRTPGP